MKIAYIISSLRNAGPIIVVNDLVKLLVAHGHECIVFYFDDKQDILFDCDVVKINFFTKIDFTQFDIVHSHGGRPDLFVLLNKKNKSNTVFISSIHSYIFQDYYYQYGSLKSFFYGHIALSIIKRHDCLIVLSKDAVKYYRKWFDDSKIEYAYNTRILDISKTLAEEEIEEIVNFKGTSKLIGVNSSMSYRKGIDLLLIALKSLPSVRLFLVGDGDNREEFIALSKKYGVDKQVHFAGYKPDAYRYLPYYDLYAIPSRSEGFPLSMLEAASIGKNIVCSDIPVFKEVFTEDEVSFFELDNMNSLVLSIERALNDISFGKNAKAKFIKTYSPECMYNKYIEIYSKRKQKKNGKQ